MVTPRQYATIHELPYTTVMYWLQNGKIDGAVKHETPTGHYWELPDNTPRPPSMAGRPPNVGAKRRDGTQKGRSRKKSFPPFPDTTGDGHKQASTKAGDQETAQEEPAPAKPKRGASKRSPTKNATKAAKKSRTH